MKRPLFIAVLMCLSGISYAQQSDSTMKNMFKSQLTSIYIEQVNILLEKLPYSAFALDGKGMDIPNSKYLFNKQERIAAKNEAYAEVLNEEIHDLIPYADKERIIEAILYLREINASMRLIINE